MKGKLTKVTLKKILKYKKYIQTNNPSFFIFNFNNTYLNKCIFNVQFTLTDDEKYKSSTTNL